MHFAFMKTVTLRGMPDELHARLKLRAQKNRRSLNKQIIAELAESAETEQRTKAETLLARTDELRAQLGTFATAEEIDEAKRYGRR